MTSEPQGSAGTDLTDGPRSADQLTRSSLSAQIAQRLRNDIVHGVLAPGVRLVQDELCQRFGTSRMPVRDALQQLTHEGLLEQRGQQRIVVSLDRDDLEETQVLIAVLHGWAAGLAASVASDEELAELAEICREAVRADDVYDFSRLAMLFHRKINLMAHSPRLIRTLQGFEQTVPRTIPFTVPEEIAPSKVRYQGIVAALQDRDSDQAERLTRAHSLMAVRWLLNAIDSDGHPEAPG
jgi:DNA-binding GntR family transcriptional regulator